MPEVATAYRLAERFQDCAAREDFASLLGELGAGVSARGAEGNAETGRALVRRYFEMWNTGDSAEADALLGPTYLDHAHPAVLGPAAVRSLVRRFRSENREARIAADIVAFDAEFVVVRRAIRWGRKGSEEPCGLALFRVEGGQLAEQWSSPPGAGRAPALGERRAALRNYF
jgi:predicted SnoaL-like aldol condensation-catalyzing enzyme